MKKFHSFRIWSYLCSLMHDSEVMCRKKADTPWSINRVLTAHTLSEHTSLVGGALSRRLLLWPRSAGWWSGSGASAASLASWRSSCRSRRLGTVRRRRSPCASGTTSAAVCGGCCRSRADIEWRRGLRGRAGTRSRSCLWRLRLTSWRWS